MKITAPVCLTLALCATLSYPVHAAAFDQAHALFEKGRYASAAKALQQETVKNPADTQAGLLLVRTLLRLDKWQQALQTAQALVLARYLG